MLLNRDLVKRLLAVEGMIRGALAKEPCGLRLALRQDHNRGVQQG